MFIWYFLHNVIAVYFKSSYFATSAEYIKWSLVLDISASILMCAYSIKYPFLIQNTLTLKQCLIYHCSQCAKVVIVDGFGGIFDQK